MITRPFWVAFTWSEWNRTSLGKINESKLSQIQYIIICYLLHVAWVPKFPFSLNLKTMWLSLSWEDHSWKASSQEWLNNPNFRALEIRRVACYGVMLFEMHSFAIISLETVAAWATRLSHGLCMPIGLFRLNFIPLLIHSTHICSS